MPLSCSRIYRTDSSALLPTGSAPVGLPGELQIPLSCVLQPVRGRTSSQLTLVTSRPAPLHTVGGKRYREWGAAFSHLRHRIADKGMSALLSSPSVRLNSALAHRVSSAVLPGPSALPGFSLWGHMPLQAWCVCVWSMSS